MCQLHLDQHRVSLRLNLSTYSGAIADPEYVRMVAPQFDPRMKVANFTSALVFEHRSKLTSCYKQLDFIVAVWSLLEYPFPGKVGSDLGEEKPITSIRWTTQFVRVRRISDLYNPT